MADAWKSWLPGGRTGPVADVISYFQETPGEKEEEAAAKALDERQKAEKDRVIQLLAAKGYDEAQAAQIWEQLGKPVDLGDKVYIQAAEAVTLGIDVSQGTWSQQYEALKTTTEGAEPADPDAPLDDTEMDELYGPWMRVSGRSMDEIMVLQEALEMSGGDLTGAMSMLDKMMGIEPSMDVYQQENIRLTEENLALQRDVETRMAQEAQMQQQMEIAQMPASNWIQQWGMQQPEGETGPGTPPTPDWLAQHSKLQPGQPVQEAQVTTPSVQSWGQMAPSEQEGMTGYLRWMGAPAEDFYSRMRKLAPPGGSGGWSWQS